MTSSDQRSRILAGAADVNPQTAARFLNRGNLQPKSKKALLAAWPHARANHPSLDWAGTRYGAEVAK